METQELLEEEIKITWKSALLFTVSFSPFKKNPKIGPFPQRHQ